MVGHWPCLTLWFDIGFAWAGRAGRDMNLRSPGTNLYSPGSILRNPVANLRSGVVKDCLRRAGQRRGFPWNSGLFEMWRICSGVLQRASFSTPVRRLGLGLRRFARRLRRFVHRLRKLVAQPRRFGSGRHCCLGRNRPTHYQKAFGRERKRH